MKNQAKEKAANDENEPGNRLNSRALTLHNALFYQVGEGLAIPLFEPGKTEEEILIDLVGELSIPTKSLNAKPSNFKQSWATKAKDLLQNTQNKLHLSHIENGGHLLKNCLCK